MRAAQSLYEAGYITYMRTDSTTLSDTALAAARAEIDRRYGREHRPEAPRLYNKKVKNAQDAGAVGVIVANNAAKGLPGMGGSDPTIVIPSVGISQADGAAIKAALASHGGGHHARRCRGDDVVAALFLDSRYRQGADERLRVKLYAPDPEEPGSSRAHWDTTATPNLLMEPFINDDLRATETLDLTPSLLRDLGWRLLQ
jgi:hypothetical protein